jgi:hypothetical protein
MKKLISFCEKAAGEGQSQCELRLKIQMGMKPGNSFSQMAKGFGSGAASSSFGMGQGSGGMSGSSTPFDMYGSETPHGKPGDSKPGGKRKKKIDAGVDSGPEDPLSGNIEELAKPEQEDLELLETAGERIMEEYGALIRAYFERVAEEE